MWLLFQQDTGAFLASKTLVMADTARELSEGLKLRFLTSVMDNQR